MGTMETLSLRSRPGFGYHIWAARTSVVVGAAAAFANAQTLDSVILSFWRGARESMLVKHDTFEPILATVSFALWIGLFRLLDRFPVLRQYKMMPDEVAKEGKKSLLPPRHAWLSGILYLAPFFILDSVYPRRKLPETAPSFAWLLTELVAGVVLYDFIFFWMHMAVHKFQALRFIGHQQHHRKTPLDATETVNHSLLDGSLQVLANVLALNLLRSHPLTRGAHNILVTYMVSEAHCGFDMPWMLHNLLPRKLLGGPPAHEAHHQWGNVHYQQLLTYLDGALGHLDPPSAGKRVPLRAARVRIGCLWVLGSCLVASWRWYVIGAHTQAWPILATAPSLHLEGVQLSAFGFGNASLR